jgi:hypothetical protein
MARRESATYVASVIYTYGPRGISFLESSTISSAFGSTEQSRLLSLLKSASVRSARCLLAPRLLQQAGSELSRMSGGFRGISVLPTEVAFDRIDFFLREVENFHIAERSSPVGSAKIPDERMVIACGDAFQFKAIDELHLF